jgi:hypothetical protein
MTGPCNFFRHGSNAVCIQEISHWWIADNYDGPGKAALYISMRNGQQAAFFPKDDNSPKAKEIEADLLACIEQLGN